VGAPDIVVNNAGVYPSGFLIDIDAAEWDRIFGVNLRAPFLISRGFAKQMIAARQPGSIINISSGAARKMRRTVAPYCVSKTALDRLTKGFALELAEFGIRVNAVEPGFAPGSMSSPLTPAHVEATLGQIPLGARHHSGRRRERDPLPVLGQGRLRHGCHAERGRWQLDRHPRGLSGKEAAGLAGVGLVGRS
jgi:NAD(P)-dependent dehydrogenase (short-subunit alcohol dehydrogenase family)